MGGEFLRLAQQEQKRALPRLTDAGSFLQVIQRSMISPLCGLFVILLSDKRVQHDSLTEEYLF